MPTVLRINGYRFFFFSREETRKHIHICSGNGEAKFWISPEIELARNSGYSRQELKTIENIIEENHEYISRAWDEHFRN
jgi:hypothetical protein